MQTTTRIKSTRPSPLGYAPMAAHNPGGKEETTVCSGLVLAAGGVQNLILLFWLCCLWTGQLWPRKFIGCHLGPDVTPRRRKKVTPRYCTACKPLNRSCMNYGHRALACDPLGHHGRLDSQVLCQPDATPSNRIEPFNKFFHSAIIRPSLMLGNRYCLKGYGS